MFGRNQAGGTGGYDVAGHAGTVPGHVHTRDAGLEIGGRFYLGGEKLDLGGLQQGFVIGHARYHMIELFQAFDDVG